MAVNVLVGLLFLIVMLGHVVIVAAIFIGRVMKPPGRILVGVYLTLNAFIALLIANRLIGGTSMDEEVVVVGITVGVLYSIITWSLAFYGALRAFQQR